MLSRSIEYPYKENGILPDRTKVPDIPTLNILLVRRDLGKGLAGDSIIDTGFDGAIYANRDVAEFLEALTPSKNTSLWAAGHEVGCEIFEVECHICDLKLNPVLPLGTVQVHVPLVPEELSEDVLVGRSILNKLRLELNGRLLKLLRS